VLDETATDELVKVVLETTFETSAGAELLCDTTAAVELL
jgi:hypothetical protein